MARWLTVIVLIFAAFSATANEYSVTPFVGYRFSDALEDNDTGIGIDLDNTSSFGALFSVKRDNKSTYDFHYSRQDTVVHFPGSVLDNQVVRIDYYHIGGTNDYEDEIFNPFATGGFGVTHVEAPGSGFPSETKLSMSFGGGVKVPITDNAGLRFEARAYGTTVSGVARVLCANGGCTAQFNGSLYLQFDFNVGLTMQF